ncbi:MAG: hypothetical protein J6N98_00025 [Prevotella sp.]|nr:hypothetical protein [Prevotella sp.]
MKKITLMLMALLAFAGSMKAKSFVTTLWEDTYTGTIELNAETVATFNEGNVLRIYVTVPAGGANFNIVYKGAPAWAETAIPSIDSQWPWVNGGNTYYDVTLTAADITALDGQNIYITKGENSTINKVVLTGEIAPTSETELLDASWTASWTAKTFAAQSGVKIGDVIRFSYSAPGGWSYFQFNILDAYGNANAFVNTNTNVGTSIETAADLTFDFEITNLSDMQKIQNEGFGIKGDNFTLNSVKLLTYADSYDAVSVTIGADEVATFSCAKNLDFTDTGIKAYYASAVAAGQVKMTETATTWNYCGYILKGSAGTYTVKVVDDKHASYPSATYLKGQVGAGTIAASTTGKYHYIFAKNSSSQIGFYKLTANHNLGANKAYLETDEDIVPAPGARIEMLFDGETTGISQIDNGQWTTDNYYDLQGRKVAQPTHGLYVVNGKKVVIK